MILFPTTHTFQRTDFFRSSRLYHNAERARTCNSVVTKVPGLFASVNNSTDPETDTIIGYISPAGIPSIASQKEQEHDVITPYGAWPTIMFDKAVGLAWWHNMVTAKKMQSELHPVHRSRSTCAAQSSTANICLTRPLWQHRVDES